VKIETIVCRVIIEAISLISPPSCLANTKEEGAVGIAAKITTILKNRLSNLKYTPKAYITIGVITNFKNVEIRSAAFASFKAFNSKEKPTDNNPIGRAAELNILKIFSAIIGKVISK
jgi:hypothetical protein